MEYLKLKIKWVPPSIAFFVLVWFYLLSSLVFAEDAETVFKGIPSIKISEGGTDRTPESLKRDSAIPLSCVISKIGNDYFWASRENVKMTKFEGSGAFTTFVAGNGAGYVRIIKPEQKTSASLMSETEKTFDYVEHITIGLRSVTYFGKSQ